MLTNVFVVYVEPPGLLDILYLYLLNLATLTGKHVEKGIRGEIQHICLKCAGGRDWKERSWLDPLLRELP